MGGTEDNENAKSFDQAPLDEGAGRLEAILREERPEVVVTYAEDGTYGHPDHIKAHQVTNAALDLLEKEGWRPRKLYYTVIPRSALKAFAESLPEEARQDNIGSRIQGTPDELITTKDDVGDYIDRKQAACSRHVSPNSTHSCVPNMADHMHRLAFGT